MTNNTSTFTPSTQILEAGEKAQTLADAGKTLKPFLPQEAQQAVEGIDKVAQAFTATGRALEHFGFDEAELEVTTSVVELIPTDHSPVVDNMNPTWGDFFPDSLRPSSYVIEGGQVLQENGWEETGQAIETAGQVMRAFGFDEAEADRLTGTGPTMPAFDQDEPLKWSEAMKEVGGVYGAVGGIAGATGAGAPVGAVFGAAGGVLYLGGTILGAFGLDVDESEPTIPEVGVDALA